MKMAYTGVGTAKLEDLQRQSGAVLIISLVMLLLLTIIGMSAVDITTLGTRISANTKDRALAFDAAETALNIAGGQLAPSEGAPSSATPGFLASGMSDSWWHSETDAWWASNAELITDYAGVYNGSSGIGYVIEQPVEIRTNGAGQRVANVTLGEPRPVTRFYRTTARGEGPGGTEVFIQSVFARKSYLNTVE
jgi:type IV pilus assembly protein PilX